MTYTLYINRWHIRAEWDEIVVSDPIGKFADLEELKRAAHVAFLAATFCEDTKKYPERIWVSVTPENSEKHSVLEVSR
jgi:hypothetical protein